MNSHIALLGLHNYHQKQHKVGGFRDISTQIKNKSPAMQGHLIFLVTFFLQCKAHIRSIT